MWIYHWNKCIFANGVRTKLLNTCSLNLDILMAPPQTFALGTYYHHFLLSPHYRYYNCEYKYQLMEGFSSFVLCLPVILARPSFGKVTRAEWNLIINLTVPTPIIRCVTTFIVGGGFIVLGYASGTMGLGLLICAIASMLCFTTYFRVALFFSTKTHSLSIVYCMEHVCPNMHLI